MLTGNKGEWAELYAFLKILCDTKLPAANAKLEPDPGRFFEFISLDWNDPIHGQIEYKFSSGNILVSRISDGFSQTVPQSAIQANIGRIFSAIQAGKRTFSIPIAEQIMTSLMRTSLKAPSAEKSDIFCKLLDRNTNTAELSGFSVKSMLKNQATLLNHSGQTVFRYQVVGLSNSQASQIALITNRSSSQKYIDRMKLILSSGGALKFYKMKSKNFERTLRRIDSLLPEFVAEMLLGFFSQNGRTLSELVGYLAASSSLTKSFSFDLEKDDFEFKLKQLLSASALGMQPSKIWDGMMKANGGYLVVMATGEVFCYHAYNRDVFLNYLFNHTMFESPGGRSSPYLEIVYDKGKMFTDLKLQIRFTK